MPGPCLKNETCLLRFPELQLHRTAKRPFNRECAGASQAQPVDKSSANAVLLRVFEHCHRRRFLHEEMTARDLFQRLLRGTEPEFGGKINTWKKRNKPSFLGISIEQPVTFWHSLPPLSINTGNPQEISLWSFRKEHGMARWSSRLRRNTNNQGESIWEPSPLLQAMEQPWLRKMLRKCSLMVQQSNKNTFVMVLWQSLAWRLLWSWFIIFYHDIIGHGCLVKECLFEYSSLGLITDASLRRTSSLRSKGWVKSHPSFIEALPESAETPNVLRSPCWDMVT